MAIKHDYKMNGYAVRGCNSIKIVSCLPSEKGLTLKGKIYFVPHGRPLAKLFFFFCCCFFLFVCCCCFLLFFFLFRFFFFFFFFFLFYSSPRRKQIISFREDPFSSPLLHSVPQEGCASIVWHFLGIFAYVFWVHGQTGNHSKTYFPCKNWLKIFPSVSSRLRWLGIPPKELPPTL